MDITQLVEEFAKLEVPKQKEKLLVMLEEIKASDPMFVELSEIIATREDLDASFLTGIYQDILELGDAIQNYDKTTQMEKLSSLQNKLKDLQAREAQERAEEMKGAEELLNNL